MLAAAATLGTPVFLLSATTVMADVTMLCAYVWAVWFWVRGMREEKTSSLVVASVLIAVATLTKYFAVTLLPLLLAYGLMTKRRPGAWMLPLLLPVAILAAYHVWTKSLYGHGLLLDAAGYATQQRWTTGAKVLASVLTGLAFTGGCCATVVVLLGVASPRMAGVVLAAGMIVTVALVLAVDPMPAHSVRAAGAIRWGFLVQLALWSVCGFALVAAVVHDASTTRTSESALLALWVIGTFGFAVFVNWNVAGRSILPMAPAAAIVAARMWTRRAERSALARAAWVPWSVLVPAAALALLVAGADASLARTQRDAARQISDALAEPAGRIYFSGHWGFQHYMEQRGALPIDKQRTQLDVGDVVILPDNNSLRAGLPPGAARVSATFRFAPMPWLSTMREETHAGFYSDIWGPLPFAFARVPTETYHVLVVEVPLRRRP
jgi:4-amino-4-deoxy-L-arabinose transferase-like glycosyltransferase